jgi:gas vesicle protein
MSGGKLSKENRKQLKNEIENLLSTISSDQNEDMLIDNQLADELKAESPFDFELMSDQFTEKARSITDSLFKNFVDIGIFEKNDYAKHKKELDTINISNLFFQLKTLKIAIMKVMEEISSGNTHPRLLEVMGQLQDKMANITKTQANYILFLEDTYKKLNSELPVNPDSTQVESSSSEGRFFVSVGTKNVIESLPESDLTDDFEDASLIDPRNKANLLKDTDLDVSVGDNPEGDDYIDLTEII